MRGWIEWFARGLWKRRSNILKVTAVSVLVIGAAVYRTVDWSGRPPRTIDDPQFERAANALCQEKLRPLAEERRSSAENAGDTPKANARKIERVAAKLEAVVTELRALPHKAQYDREIEAWLAEFDAYIDAGRGYAEALRTEDPEVYDAADDRSEAPHRAIAEFAEANHIDACNP